MSSCGSDAAVGPVSRFLILIQSTECNLLNAIMIWPSLMFYITEQPMLIPNYSW